MVFKPKSHISDPQGKQNGAVIEVSRHLGIKRMSSNNPRATLQCRIKESRRSVYHLSGVGLYSSNGVGPRVSLQMIKTYIIPTLTYGLEALILKDSDYQPLETYYKTLLRQIQHLPENTATPAIYLLLGCIPLEGQIHIRLLTFFGDILSRPGTIENDTIN